LSPELLRDVAMQAARERQDEGHDVRADVVVEDLAEVRHDHRVRDELRIVVPGGRRRLGRLEPAQPRRLAQQAGRHRAERGLGVAHHPRGLGRILGDHDGERGQRGGDAGSPRARRRRLRRQHQERDGHGVDITRYPRVRSTSSRRG
jgi:hypothetical protein